MKERGLGSLSFMEKRERVSAVEPFAFFMKEAKERKQAKASRASWVVFLFSFSNIPSNQFISWIEEAARLWAGRPYSKEKRIKQTNQ